MVDRQIATLEQAMNPTSGTVTHGPVWEGRRELMDQWKAYKSLFQDTDLEDDEEEAAEAEFTGRMLRYTVALGPARDLLESTGSEAESLRERSNSTSSQAGDDATTAPTHCKLAVKNAEVMIIRQIKGLKDSVDQENTIAPTAWREKHNWIISSEL